MSQGEFDKLLRAALLDAQAQRWEPVASSGPLLSWEPARASLMQRLYQDPFGYGKRHTRPAWSRALRRIGQAAACLLLAGSVTLAVSPAARAWVSHLFIQWFPDHVDYEFTGTGQGEPGAWRPSYLPEGFQLTEIFEPSSRYGSLTYENAEGDRLIVDYYFESVQDLGFDNEHSDRTSAEVNGMQGELYVSNTSGKPSYLIWVDEKENTCFLVFGQLSTEELIRIGESLEKVQ